MLKRTKGRILLTLLVVTGFAGTVSNTAPTKEERKAAVDYLKNSKQNLKKDLKGLNRSQLDYKNSGGSWSVRECYYHIVLSEIESWKILEKAMKEPSSPEERAGLSFTDEELLAMLADRSNKMQSPAHLNPAKAPWKSMEEARAAFKQARTESLKYMKTTTADLRNHFVTLPIGRLDCYQFILYISAHSARHHEQISGIINDPGFPN